MKKKISSVCNAEFILTNATTNVKIKDKTKTADVTARCFLHITLHCVFAPTKKNVDANKKMLHRVYGIANFDGLPASFRSAKIEITPSNMPIPTQPNHPMILCLYVSCT